MHEHPHPPISYVPKSSILMRMPMSMLLHFAKYMSVLARYQNKVCCKQAHICTIFRFTNIVLWKDFAVSMAGHGNLT